MLLVDRLRPPPGGPPAAAAGAAHRQLGYTLHWPGANASAWCGWDGLPAALAAHAPSAATQLPALSGPLWVGPLHSLGHLRRAHAEAEARGWLPAEAPLPATRKGSVGSLGELLELLLEEAAAEEAAAAAAGGAAASEPAAAAREAASDAAAARPGLPPWYLRMNDIGRAGALVGPPPRAALAAELRRRCACRGGLGTGACASAAADGSTAPLPSLCRGFVAARSHVDPGALRTNASLEQAVAAAVEGLGIVSRRRGGREE